jgi:type IV pilus assembly protein PilW
MKNGLSQSGISLIEIMIALLIGAFLLGGVLQIFIGGKQTYRMQESLCIFWPNLNTHSDPT